MMLLAEFHFIRPGWLLLLPIAILLWWLAGNAEDSLRGWRSMIQPELLEALTVEEQVQNPESTGTVARWAQGHVLIVAWSIGIVSVAGPTWRPEPSPFADDPVPVMLVLRAGESMNQSDMMPSRMERARLKVIDFANARKGQPLGLIAYSGSSHLVLPPTRDTEVVATMAAEIGPEIMPKSGDALSSALRLAVKSSGDRGGSILVIADTIEEPTSSLASFRSESNLAINVLAVARKETPELAAIRAAATSLSANVTLLAPDSSDTDSLVRRTAKAPVSVESTDAGTHWEEAGWWLVPALAIIVAASFRREQTSETAK